MSEPASEITFAIDETRQRMSNKHTKTDGLFIARNYSIFRAIVGSQVHGTSVGADDRDEIGICVEPARNVIGLFPFEQYVYRTQPEGHRSGPGDIDLTVYSLRKWLRLALAGNPTILLGLFIPPHMRKTTRLGDELIGHADRIVSADAGRRFAGYLARQRESMMSHHGKGRDVTRPELIEAYGWDTKYGGHMVRLGLQGVELLETGKITLPMPEPWRTYIVDMRNGKYTMKDALAITGLNEAKLLALTKSPLIRPQPDWEYMSDWLCSAYRRYWGGVPGL